MSMTAAAPANFLRPWQKLTIWGMVAVVILAIVLLFSGKINLISHKKEPKVQLAMVQKTIDDTGLNYPPDTTPKRPSYAGPPKAKERGMTLDEDRLKGIRSNNSPNVGMNHASAATSGAAPAAVERPAPGSADALEASLTPTTMEGTKVAELPDPRWLIEAGRLLPCLQQTRINSTLPGSVTAIIPEAIKGETGDVVLLDKGAKIFGTIQRALMNGADRLGVLWQHIDTPVLYDDRGMPHQFRVAVNSPAASELGETGLDGDVNRHLAPKIGGILGYSAIQGGIQALIQSEMAKSNGTQINLNSFQNGGNQAADALLNAWVAIPDVMTRDQGLHCSIAVIRDLDMRAAYQLRRKYRSSRS